MKGFDKLIDSYDRVLKLVSVEHIEDPDLPDPPAVCLCFGESSLYVYVREDDDCLVVDDALPDELENLPRAEVSHRRPWSAAVGMLIQWAWSMQNQQGYEDGIQLEFQSEDHARSCGVQLVGVASCLSIREVVEV